MDAQAAMFGKGGTGNRERDLSGAVARTSDSRHRFIFPLMIRIFIDERVGSSPAKLALGGNTLFPFVTGEPHPSYGLIWSMHAGLGVTVRRRR